MRDSRRTPVACGVDIGSTNIKVVAIDPDGVVVARASRPTPRDADGLSIEGPALLDAVEALVAQTCGDRYRVHAICCTGIGEDGLLVDATLRPLTTALAWFDPRRQSIFRELRPTLTLDETFDAATDPARTMVGWTWARREPGSAAARSWIALADLPTATWCGQPFLSDTLASRTGAWRTRDRSWAADRIAATLGSADVLPPVVPSGRVIGHITSATFAQSGILAADAIGVAGGHDHPIGGWIVDQMTPGAVLDSMGTAEVVVRQSSSPVTSHDNVDIAPGIRSAGSTVLRVEELARNIAWASQDPAVAASIRALLSGSTPPESILGAGYFVPGHRGGGTPSYSLDAPRDPQSRATAVLGALAHIGAEAVEAVRRESGPDTTESGAVRLAGGWARSPGWIAIKEAVSGYRAEPIAEPEVTAVGAAFLAATARGWHPDPAAALAGTPIDPRL